MNTTPIENIVGYTDTLLLQALEIAHLQLLYKLNCVQLHTQKLGKRTGTFTGSEFRFNVWTTDKWTVYVNNKKGVCFEVPEGTDAPTALAAWEDYRQKMLTTSSEEV